MVLERRHFMVLMVGFIIAGFLACMAITAIVNTIRNPNVEYYNEVIGLNQLKLSPYDFHCVELVHTNLLESLFSSSRFRCFDTISEADRYIQEQITMR